jgi:hypothetical protein
MLDEGTIEWLRTEATKARSLASEEVYEDRAQYQVGRAEVFEQLLERCNLGPKAQTWDRCGWIILRGDGELEVDKDTGDVILFNSKVTATSGAAMVKGTVLSTVRAGTSPQSKMRQIVEFCDAMTSGDTDLEFGIAEIRKLAAQGSV